jgi:hypothetical protein
MNETLLIIKQLFAAYPNATVDEEAIVIYLQMLAGIPPEELRMAVFQCIAEYKFLPGVAEILETHRTLKGSLIEQTAGEAWGSVEKALREVGSWGVPKFRNALTGRVVEMMGWRNLCGSDKPGVDRAQFMRMYEEVAQRSQSVDRMLPEVRNYFEANVQKRLAETSNVSDGLRGELRRLGLIEDNGAKEN